MVKVVTDSTCDIPLEIARQLSITIVPLYIQIGAETYRDGVDLKPDRVSHELVHGRESPKTSVPSPGDFVTVYNNLAAETDEIISIHLSPGYSGTHDVAKLAQSYIGGKCRVEVIDSNSVSVGLGLIVIAAARAAQEGKNLDQILDIIHQVIPRSRMFGKVDNFAYLFKGKRFQLTRGLILLGKISMALGIKLLGEVYDGGKIHSPILLIGRAMALNRLKRWAENFPGVNEIAIAYSTMLEEAEMLAQRLESLLPRERILITRLGCVTSTYVGPGTLVIALI
ncbi:MAG: DegV family protein [Dehalococcoidia bacterium]|nr:DegV family protein [Dehalococcoidia bacterium]